MQKCQLRLSQRRTSTHDKRLSHLILHLASVATALARLGQRLKDEQHLTEEVENPIREPRGRHPDQLVLLPLRQLWLSSVDRFNRRLLLHVHRFSVSELGSSQVVNHHARHRLDDEHGRAHRLDGIVDIEAGEAQLEEREQVLGSGWVDGAGNERRRDGRESRDDGGGAMSLFIEEVSLPATSSSSDSTDAPPAGLPAQARPARG